MLDVSCRALTFQILVLELDLLRKITSPSIHCQSTVTLLLPGLINTWNQMKDWLGHNQLGFFFMFSFLFLFLFFAFF